jgi:hypothetical protein
MIFTASEYSQQFKFRNKKVSTRTIKRMCNKKLLPSHHIARLIPGSKGTWVIEVPESAIDTKFTLCPIIGH